MKIMLPATLLVALAACSKKDVNTAPGPVIPVWKLTEIAGSGFTTVFYYNPAGEPSAWATHAPAITDSTTVSWVNGKPRFTYLFFNQQQRIDKSYLFSGDHLTRIQYHNFDHAGQWTVTDYDSLVYEGNRLAELHVVNAGARNQLFRLHWDNGNITRCDSYDLHGETEILTETTAYAYNSEPALANAFQPWFYFIYTKHQFPVLSANELIREERFSATGNLRWRNTYGPSYQREGRLERMTRLHEDFSLPATENSAKNYVYRQKHP
ncbi:hypothetical protein [Chitinophaga sp.]|uniref:hypothetical protein n=1 Tax=Chitinophaga sp. TaxID=1869181 RepID=UPI002639915C|nr:hypothetical protein [uncultured Chitinophaga sp.]